MNAVWDALTREAGLAAEHFGIGVTALGRANYAQHAHYHEAFFALGIGLERSGKLAIALDYALENNGSFPASGELRKYSHNLKDLLEKLDTIALKHGFSETNKRLPRSPISTAIINVLTEFASNITRYYNLEFISGEPRVANKEDPIAAWFRHVIQPILAAHYKPHHKQGHKNKAQLLEQYIGNNTLVRQTSEDGAPLHSVFDASMQTSMTDFAKPYTRMYVMQIIRFEANLVSKLGALAQERGLENIPDLSDFFRIYNNSDEYFKQRKTWSIYKP